MPNSSLAERRVEAPIRVTALWITPVKGTRLQRVQRIELDRIGARGNRLFFVIDEQGRMVNAKKLGELQSIVAQLGGHDGSILALTFPDGSSVEAPVELGEPVAARFFSRIVQSRTVAGPWSEALSRFLGEPMKLVRTDTAVDRGRRAGASLISRGSLERLAAEAGQSSLDARRFRMLIEIDGVPAHAEDDWVGQSTRIGAAAISWGGHVGRCLITSREPDSGRIDLATLDVLGRYRKQVKATEPLPFGVYGEVVQPGSIAIDDRLVFVP